MTKRRLPPVDHYKLFSDGIEAPLKWGIRRALKHSDLVISDEQIERICERQHDELTMWFCDAYRLDEGEK
jgi:hypothetical protein